MATSSPAEPRRVRRFRAYRAPARGCGWRNTLIGWSFILPNFIGFALLTLVPVVVLFYFAFTNWNVFGTATGSARELPAAARRRQLPHSRCSTPSTTRRCTSR